LHRFFLFFLKIFRNYLILNKFSCNIFFITYNIDKSIYQTFIYEAKKKVSSIGCGDALLSGTIYGLIEKKNMHEAINYGKKAASLTMEVKTACHPLLSRESLED
jgi:sugar/nucleoside kinase (ribokinase family)